MSRSPIARYGRKVQAMLREIWNKHLLLSVMLYAASAVPATWDQGSSAVIANLPGFQKHFGISSGTDASKIRYLISLIYIGMGVGAMLSFFVNDRVGRLWSYRIYISIYIIGQLIHIFAPNVSCLYAARIISGLGQGGLTVIGPLSIVEISPAEVRGLLTAWFGVAMAMAQVAAQFCVYGVYLHMPSSKLQYQIVWGASCIFMFLCAVASFFACESPRWLYLVAQPERAKRMLVRLRGLPEHHLRIQRELQDIDESIHKELDEFGRNGHGFLSIIKETFTVPSNLRRVQQTLISYGLAQLSGANSVTSYLVPILKLMGLANGVKRSIFLSGMYAFAKMWFVLIASFFFIDALGRRKSLFIGISLQMISDIYIGVYIKYLQAGDVPRSASQAGLAAIFIHGFGYCIGLFILPYVFGGELWPNRIRSFGGAMSQCFHWLFIYGFQSGLPSLLSQTHNWGAFIFFASACFLSLVYVFFMVPELSGLSVEEIDGLFKGPWFNAYKRTKKSITLTRADKDVSDIPEENKENKEMAVHVEE